MGYEQRAKAEVKIVNVFWQEATRPPSLFEATSLGFPAQGVFAMGHPDGSETVLNFDLVESIVTTTKPAAQIVTLDGAVLSAMPETIQ